MKITTYSVNGTETYGVVTDDGIIDAKPLAGGPQTLGGAIAAGALDIIAEAAALRPVNWPWPKTEQMRKPWQSSPVFRV